MMLLSLLMTKLPTMFALAQLLFPLAVVRLSLAVLCSLRVTLSRPLLP